MAGNEIHDMDEDVVSQLTNCKAFVKLKQGDLHLITMENAQEIFEILDVSEQGELSPEDLRILKTIPELNLGEEDIDNLIRDCDKDKSHKISPQELLKALQQGSICYKMVLDDLNKGPKVYNTSECTRDELIEFLREEHETNDALCSLPITLLSFFLFILLVVYHFELRTSYGMESNIEGELDGEGKPFLGTHVHDVPTFWDWMNQSYVAATFKSSAAQLTVDPIPGRYVAFNQIIGGTQVIKHQYVKAGKCPVTGDTLLKYYDTRSPNDGCPKLGNTNITREFFFYHLDSGEIQKHITALSDSSWIDQGTKRVDFRNLYYNAHLNMFTDFTLIFDWQKTGFVEINYNMETFQADPYYNKMLILIDVLYTLIMARMLYAELKEMIPRLLNGLDGFIQYWEFWNVVDWVNIVLGTTSFAVWGILCMKTGVDLQEAIQKLPTAQLDNWVLNNQTYFNETQLIAELGGIASYEEQLKNVHQISAEIKTLHSNLRVITFFYSFSLMMKFFKAFQANPRLNIVVMTMSESATDIIHFSIVFITIFFVFSLMAHVVFGNQMEEFHGNERAFFITWRILLGDFPMDGMEKVSFFLANLWFFVFQILVVMILLNMLLAIIMDTYSSVVNSGGKKTIWFQVREAVSNVRETRGHLPLLYIRCEMEDEDQRAHPGERVNYKSLRKAFERDKMTRNNAEYLIRKTNEWLKEKEEKCDLTMHDAVRLVGQTKTAVMKMGVTTEKTLQLLKAAERAPMEARHDAIMAGLDPDDPHFAEQMQASSMSNMRKILPPMLPPPMLPNSFPGIPVNGHPHSGLGEHPMSNIVNGASNGFDTFGAHGAQNFLPMQMMAFTPSNAHNNARLDGTFSTRDPVNAADNSFHRNSPQSFDKTGQSFRNRNGNDETNHLNMSDNPQPLNETSDIPALAVHGNGGLMSAQFANMMLEKMSQMQQSMEVVTKSNLELKDYISERDAWLEQRFTMLDRRCQKVEVLSDRLHNLLRAVNITDIADVPRQVSKALDNHFDKFEDLHPGKNIMRDSEAFGVPSLPHLPMFDAVDPHPNAGQMPSARRHHSDNGSGHGDWQQIRDRLKSMSDQIDQVLAHTEDTPQISKLLWRMDLNLRKLTGTAHNLPEGHPLLQQQGAESQAISQVDPVTRSSAGTSLNGNGQRSGRYLR